MDLTSLSDAELANQLNAILAEQERRQRLANAPQQLAELTARYLADGGDRDIALEAVTNA